MTQKDPGGDVIEDLEGQRLIDMIEESGSMAVYFCKWQVPTLKYIQRLLKTKLTLFKFNWQVL